MQNFKIPPKPFNANHWSIELWLDSNNRLMLADPERTENMPYHNIQKFRLPLANQNGIFCNLIFEHVATIKGQRVFQATEQYSEFDPQHSQLALWSSVLGLHQFLIETNSNNSNSNQAKEIERTYEEIIEQTELLADEFLQIEGWKFHSEEKLRYRLNNPRIQKAWLMACRAQEVLTQTEVENCLANLENDE